MSLILIVTVLFLFFQGNTAQDDTTPEVTVAPEVVTPPSDNGPPPPPGVDIENIETSGIFLDPEIIDDGVDSFKYIDKEYLFIKPKIRFTYSNFFCKKYNAELATIKTAALGNFMAEALSETNLLLDSLWIWGTLTVENKWMWKALTNETDNLDEQIIKDFVYSDKHGGEKNCLSFGRSDHDKPQFRPLDCVAERSVICERPYVPDHGADNSSHIGWITIKKRQYKIFREHVDYNTARMKCRDFDRGVDLAVIPDSMTVQILSRYLLIGRPSLENAWTQAKFMNNHFMYPTEHDIVLSNTTIASTDGSPGFPPWRNGVIQKPSGCVLLDRHLADIGLFVEARCQRLRPYICHRMANNGSEVTTHDTIIGDFGYRLVHNQLPWLDACNFCKNEYKDYGAKLAEPQNPELVKHLIIFMGEYKLAVLHIWIGGKMESLQWIWDNDEHVIDPEIISTYGITNTTFSEAAENMNVCLNFDRENHDVALIYGTSCAYPQSFVCMFDKEKLLQLIEHENGNIETVTTPP